MRGRTRADQPALSTIISTRSRTQFGLLPTDPEVIVHEANVACIMDSGGICHGSNTLRDTPFMLLLRVVTNGGSNGKWEP